MRIGVRRAFGYACGTIAFAALGLHVILYAYYAGSRPRYPEPSLGRTIPLNFHGRIVYLTSWEDHSVWWPLIGLAAFGGLSGIFLTSASKRP